MFIETIQMPPHRRMNDTVVTPTVEYDLAVKKNKPLTHNMDESEKHRIE